MAHPCDLLPPELWRVISRKLGPQDLYNLAHAHPFWSTMLERERPTFTMQLCMPLIPGLQLRDLLNLRLVNKASKQAVDYYLQHQVYEKKPFINEKEPARTDFTTRSWFVNRFIRKQEVLIVDPEFEDAHPTRIGAWLDSLDLASFPHVNPIPSREAIFYIWRYTWESEELKQETLDIVTRCLRAYGRHLLRCTFEMNLQTNGGTPFEREYSYLREWLNLVPNLNYLKVNFFRGGISEAELATLIQDSPLPELPNLLELRADCLPPSLLHALLQKYNRVQTLELELGSEEDLLIPMHMENLKALRVILRQRNALVCFEQLLTDSWLVNLDTLELYVNDYGTVKHTVTWGVIVAFLNAKFGGAQRLIKVGLEMPTRYEPEWCTELLEDSQKCRLRLPWVEQLKLVASNLFLLDFLLPMRHTLKKLAIENSFEDGEYSSYPTNMSVDCQELIQWNGWLGPALLGSTIWEALPQLNFIRVQSLRIQGWTYRKRLGVPIFINPSGKELSYEFEENVDWEEKANANEVAESLWP